MSWSCSCDVPKGSALPEIKRAIEDMQPAVPEDGVAQYQQQAIIEAGNAAYDLIRSKAFGGTSETGWRVQLSGHTNPKNEPREGYANDFVIITVQQIT